jgi:hypothetical protein
MMTLGPPLHFFSTIGAGIPVFLGSPLLENRSFDWLVIGLAELELHLKCGGSKDSASAMVSALERRYKRHSKENPFNMAIALHGYAGAFPLASQFMALDISQESPAVSYTEYLHRFTILNQVIQMASQLRQDIHLSNHKYMAHQLALLYQCLNQSGPSLLRFKQRIEKEFDAIKSITHGNEAPQLQDAQKKWLNQVCSDILECVSGLSHELSGPALISFFTLMGR